MQRLDLFATPVLKAVLPDFALANQALREAIDRKRAADPSGIARSNLGGWHSQTDMIDWGGPFAKHLAEFAVATSTPHLADIRQGGKRDFQFIAEMWANANAPGDSNSQHCHPGAVWSGVYYVDDGGTGANGDGGELILEDPRYPMAYMGISDLVFRESNTKPMYSQYMIRPEPGLLVLFPSWLRHAVRVHKGNRERISIAINLMIQVAA